MTKNKLTLSSKNQFSPNPKGILIFLYFTLWDGAKIEEKN